MKLRTENRITRRCLLALNVLAVLGLLCMTSARASAASAVIVPPRLEKGVSAEVGEAAVEELVRLMRANGFDTISPGQAEPAAEDAQRNGAFPAEINVHECLTPECAAEYRKLFDAPFAVQLSLFSEAGNASSVTVVITEKADAYFAGNAPIQARDVRAAVRTAYGAARERYLRGAGPWLGVSGHPEGATVYLDGSEYGRLPVAKRHVEPGMHRIEVREDNFSTFSQTVNIPTQVDHEEEVLVELSPIAGNAQLADYERNLDRKWDYVLGGVVAAAGLAHVGIGLYQMAQRGDCAERDAGVCTARYGDDDGAKRDNLLVGFGAATALIGGGIMWWAPIARLQVRASRDAAYLKVGGTF